MITIEKQIKGSEKVIKLKGELTSTCSPMLQQELNEIISGTTSLIFDLSELSYISSAGLRILLFAQKRMLSQGKMVLLNPNSAVLDVLKTIGFLKIMTVEYRNL